MQECSQKTVPCHFNVQMHKEWEKCSRTECGDCEATRLSARKGSVTNFRSPRPADWKKGGADITASLSSLLDLLIFCSARSIDHVGDLYPISSFSSVRLVSSWMTVISSCSQSNHRFRKKFQLLLAIVHLLCGSMHILRPAVVLICLTKVFFSE